MNVGFLNGKLAYITSFRKVSDGYESMSAQRKIINDLTKIFGKASISPMAMSQKYQWYNSGFEIHYYANEETAWWYDYKNYNELIVHIYRRDIFDE